MKRLGVTLGIATAGLCAVVHIATFAAALTFFWLFPCIFLLAGAVLCAKGVKSKRHFRRPTGKLAWLGFVLFIYAVLTFVHYYRTTGGSSGQSIVNGQYVSTYWNSQMVKVVTEREYRMFTNLWTRVMTAWIGMLAIFALTRFADGDHP
jgi:uncharacterized membrane protein